MLKSPNFRYRGNRYRSHVNFNDIASPQKPPVWCNTDRSMSHINRIIAIFVLKFPDFRYHGNRGCLMYISTAPWNCLTLRTPRLVQNSQLYLLY